MLRSRVQFLRHFCTFTIGIFYFVADQIRGMIREVGITFGFRVTEIRSECRKFSVWHWFLYWTVSFQICVWRFLFKRIIDANSNSDRSRSRKGRFFLIWKQYGGLKSDWHMRLGLLITWVVSKKVQSEWWFVYKKENNIGVG